MPAETTKELNGSSSGTIGGYNYILSEDNLVIEGKKWFPLWANLLLGTFVAGIFFLATPELIEIYKEEGGSANLISSVLILSFIQLMFILLIFSRYLFKQRLSFTPNDLTIERRVGRTRVFQKSEVQSLKIKRGEAENEGKVAFIILVLKNQKKYLLNGFCMHWEFATLVKQWPKN